MRKTSQEGKPTTKQWTERTTAFKLGITPGTISEVAEFIMAVGGVGIAERPVSTGSMDRMKMK
jgi:hypothetical protein